MRFTCDEYLNECISLIIFLCFFPLDRWQRVPKKLSKVRLALGDCVQEIHAPMHMYVLVNCTHVHTCEQQPRNV